MYRINLYPAGATRRAERSKSLGHAALLFILAGAHVVLLAVFFLTAMNVRARAVQVEAMVRQQKERLAEAMKTSRSVPNQIRMIVQRRNDRLAFSPVMAGVAVLIPDNLILDEIEASTAGGESARSGMVLSGRLRVGSNMDPVIEFTNRLSASPVYRQEFAEAKLGSMETTDEVARFRISCPLIEKAVPDSTGEDVPG